jgi:hypothetical protein
MQQKPGAAFSAFREMMHMPVWTCPKCGEKVENYAWGESPWKTHKCNGNPGEFSLPEVKRSQDREPPATKKKGNLSDFF